MRGRHVGFGNFCTQRSRSIHSRCAFQKYARPSSWGIVSAPKVFIGCRLFLATQGKRSQVQPAVTIPAVLVANGNQSFSAPQSHICHALSGMFLVFNLPPRGWVLAVSRQGASGTCLACDVCNILNNCAIYNCWTPMFSIMVQHTASFPAMTQHAALSAVPISGISFEQGYVSGPPMIAHYATVEERNLQCCQEWFSTQRLLQ